MCVSIWMCKHVFTYELQTGVYIWMCRRVCTYGCANTCVCTYGCGNIWQHAHLATYRGQKMTSDVLLHHFPPSPLETGSLMESGALYFPTRLAGQSANPSDPPVSALPYPSSGITGMHSHMWTHVSARDANTSPPDTKLFVFNI